jgi:hypothetical protein
MTNYQSVGYNFMLCSIFHDRSSLTDIQSSYMVNIRVIYDWLCCFCTFMLWIPWHFYIIKCSLLYTLVYSKCSQPTVLGPKKDRLVFYTNKCDRKKKRVLITKQVGVSALLLRLEISEIPFGWCWSFATHYMHIFLYFITKSINIKKKYV